MKQVVEVAQKFFVNPADESLRAKGEVQGVLWVRYEHQQHPIITEATFLPRSVSGGDFWL